MGTINLVGRGLRGVSFADLARRTASWGVVPGDSDAVVLTKFATWAGGGGGSPGEAEPGDYRYGGFAVDDIQPGEILMDHEVVDAHTLAANFAGCAASAGTAPAADWVLVVALNDTPIGTVTISAGGAVTMSSATSHAVAAGDIVTVTAPGTADPQIERVRFTFSGELDQ